MEKSKKILKVENLKKAYYSTSRTLEMTHTWDRSKESLITGEAFYTKK